MELGLGAGRYVMEIHINGVLILVVVELGLGDNGNNVNNGNNGQRLNPCCSGIRSRRVGYLK